MLRGARLQKLRFRDLTPIPFPLDPTSVVFAPTLFFIRGSKGQQMLKEVEMQITTASTLKIMLENHEQLWDVRRARRGHEQHNQASSHFIPMTGCYEAIVVLFERIIR